jgi:hypothetical protein
VRDGDLVCSSLQGGHVRICKERLPMDLMGGKEDMSTTDPDDSPLPRADPQKCSSCPRRATTQR